MFVTFCPQERNLLKRTNLFDYKPPSGQNFDVCIFLCLVKLDINSSETCADGKRKVFFFSTYSKIRIYIYSKFTFSKESYQMMTYIIYILYLPQAILSAGCEIQKVLQDPMSHYGPFSCISKRHNRTFVLHIQTDTLL